ncbi:MAG TPA: hypothetical protein VFO85_16465 [Vicinamibacteria bacterium]|nr:hypothetical protein [Vicinamibacteria bacterium]
MRRLAAVLPVAAAFAAHLAPASAATPRPSPSPAAAAMASTRAFEFRNIGPALMGGRVDDFAVVESRPSTFYVGTASGGVWKTVNNGLTFEPVFDGQTTSSIGDVTVAPSDPNTVYVGTGEPNNRQSSSWGHGVYRTRDGGKTWAHLGLEDTLHIGRIAVHPANPDVAYVAALGHLWGPNKQRGLFKTADGGKTWTNTKFIDEDTGFVDVAMDPESPDTLYAASFQRRRTPYGYNGGGPGAGVWKTTDGGATWSRLAGLPADGDVGRIGLAIYRRDPRVVYALVEHAKQGGIYRSDDRGETWRKMSDTNPRPSYYSKVHVDPGNDQRVWVLGAPMYYSEDGGRTFRTDLVQKIHGDYHALWIDPADANHMLLGSDGGIHISYDRGRSWDYVNTVPLAQFYEIHYDMRSPYWVCGGLQDNGSWCGPSRTLYQQGIGNEDWFRVGGGDGFYVVVDPSDHNILYSESQDGNVRRIDLRTNESRVIRPEAPAGEKYRFNWNSPIVISPHDPRTIYYGGHRVFVSRDRGETWAVPGPDLTTGARRDEMPILGKTARDFLSRNDGVVHYGTITTLAESPLKAGVLWAGTDDGNVQVSRDGGATWANVASRLPGVPRGTYVSRVEPSRTGEGAAYVSLDGHRADDYGVYVFFTSDFGQTWRSVAGNVARGFTVSVVREHPRQPNLLFLGTENGLWASLDRGRSWRRFSGKNLPTVPVDDVQVHPRDNDLIVATHGRGVWILDDLSALEQRAAGQGRTLDEAAAEGPELFPLRDAVQYRVYSHKGNTGHKTFLGPNPPEGVLVTYFLPSAPAEKEEVKLTVKNAAGETVRELKGGKERGFNRLNWDLRYEAPVKPDPDSPGGGFFGPPRGPLVLPGTYTVILSAGGREARREVQVREDPRITIAEAERREWHDWSRRAARLWGRADSANRTVDRVKKQLTALQDGLKKSESAETSTPEAVTAAVKALAARVEPLAQKLSRQAPMGFAGAPLADEPDPLLPSARGAFSTLGSYTAPPTPQHRESFARTEKDVEQAVAEVNALLKDVTELNRLLVDHGLGRVEGGPPLP